MLACTRRHSVLCAWQCSVQSVGDEVGPRRTRCAHRWVCTTTGPCTRGAHELNAGACRPFAEAATTAMHQLNHTPWPRGVCRVGALAAASKTRRAAVHSHARRKPRAAKATRTERAQQGLSRTGGRAVCMVSEPCARAWKAMLYGARHASKRSQEESEGTRQMSKWASQKWGGAQAVSRTSRQRRCWRWRGRRARWQAGWRTRGAS